MKKTRSALFKRLAVILVAVAGICVVVEQSPLLDGFRPWYRKSIFGVTEAVSEAIADSGRIVVTLTVGHDVRRTLILSESQKKVLREAISPVRRLRPYTQSPIATNVWTNIEMDCPASTETGHRLTISVSLGNSITFWGSPGLPDTMYNNTSERLEDLLWEWLDVREELRKVFSDGYDAEASMDVDTGR